MAGLIGRMWAWFMASRGGDDLAGLSPARLREAAAAHSSHLRLVLGVDLVLVGLQLVAQVDHVAGGLPGVDLGSKVRAYPVEFVGASMLPVLVGLFVLIFERMPPVFRLVDKFSANGGLVLVGGAAMVQSAQHVAATYGSWLYVIVIDGGATFLMVMAASRIKDRSRMLRRADEVEAAEAQAEADRVRAERRAEVERVEAERRAAVEAAAVLEAEALEHQRLLDLERARREAAAVELEALAAKGRSGDADTDSAIAAFLVANAGERNGRGPTQATVAKAVGVTPKTVGRSAAWQARRQQVEALPVDDVPVLDAGSDETAEVEGDDHPSVGLERHLLVGAGSVNGSSADEEAS